MFKRITTVVLSIITAAGMTGTVYASSEFDTNNNTKVETGVEEYENGGSSEEWIVYDEDQDSQKDAAESEIEVEEYSDDIEAEEIIIDDTDADNNSIGYYDDSDDDYDDDYDENYYEYDEFELSRTSVSLSLDSKVRLILYDDIGFPLPGDEKGLTWKSSNTKVATVSNRGYVIAVGFGKATITARFHGHSWSCRVTVKEPALSKKKATLICNKTLQLKVKNYNGKINWVSGNKKIATVSKTGKVTARRPGKANIRAKLAGRTLICAITVPEPKLSTKKASLGFKKSIKLKWKNYSGKADWTSSDSSIATVNSKGIVTAKSKAGKVTITAKLFGKKYKCKITVRDTSWDKVVKTYSMTTLERDTVWYQDRRYVETEIGDTVIHPFTVTYNDGLIFSFFPEAKTAFAIFDSAGNMVWKKTISEESHFEIFLGEGQYQLKALAKKSDSYYKGYSLRVVRYNAEFLPIEMGHFYMNSAGGVEPEFLILNNTGKTIKYINFRVVFYNRVDDKVYYFGDSYADLQLIGPIEPWECNWASWGPVFYNSSVHHICIGTAELIFMDGSTQIINVNKNYY